MVAPPAADTLVPRWRWTNDAIAFMSIWGMARLQKVAVMKKPPEAVVPRRMLRGTRGRWAQKGPPLPRSKLVQTAALHRRRGDHQPVTVDQSVPR